MITVSTLGDNLLRNYPKTDKQEVDRLRRNRAYRPRFEKVSQARLRKKAGRDDLWGLGLLSSNAKRLRKK